MNKIKKSEKISIQEGSFTGLMDGFGMRYITPYALALGASNMIIALLSTLPNLLGNLFQLHTLQLMHKRSRKLLVFVSVFTQALLWIPVIGIGVLYLFFESIRGLTPLLLLIFYSIMIIAGTTASPAWNSWMRDLIVINRGKYFGIRNRTINLVAVVSMFAASFILSYFSGQKILIGFFIIFSIALMGRLIASYLLTKQYEPEFRIDKSSYFSFRSFLRQILNNNFGRFVLFVSLISFATAVAGPFFVVYMFKNLHFSYIQYSIVTIASVLTTIVFLPKWGAFSDSFGNLKVLKITGYIIPIIPFLWVATFFFQNQPYLIAYLFVLELLAGFIWSGFNLSASTFIFDAVTREKMAICVAYFNILNSFGALAGALIGGLISSLNIPFFGLGTLMLIFVLSGILRFIVSFSMLPRLKEVRTTQDFSVKDYIRKLIKINEIMHWRFMGFKPVRLINTN